MPVVPVRFDALAALVVELVLGRAGRVRMAVDGPPPARGDELASVVVAQLRARGRAAVAVSAADYLRPASVRLEYGREDPDELLERWLDDAALRREVLDPAGPSGSGRVLPRLWNTTTDRAYRDDYVQLPDNGVVLLCGTFLLGRGLPVDVAVHLRMTAAALRRALPAHDHWTLPAFARYDAERDPSGAADMVVLADHPDRPAVRR